MKKRQTEILSILQSAKSTKADIASLVQRFAITERTLRNDVQELNHALSPGIQLVLRRGELLAEGKGDFSAAVQRLRGETDYYTYVLSSSERLMAEALIFCMREGRLTTNFLSEKLAVSRGSIMGDMRGLKTLFDKHGVTLCAKTNKGYHIEGAEENIRDFLWSLLQFSRGSADASPAFYTLIKRELSCKDDRLAIREELQAAEDAFAFELTDRDFDTVHTYLLMVVSRLKMGRELVDDGVCGDDGWFAVARHILTGLEKTCGLAGRPSEKEVEALSKLLIRCKYISARFARGDDIHLQMQLSSFVYDVAGRLGINDHMDFDQFRMLLSHIEAAVGRIAAGRGEEDENNTALVDELEKTYPDIFAEVHQRSGRFRERSLLDLSRSELAYIAMYLISFLETGRTRQRPLQAVLVCPAGMCTAMLLQARLRQHLQIEIGEILSLHKFEKADLAGVDIVISTVPLPVCTVPVAQISPILDEKDLEVLRRALDRNLAAAKRQKPTGTHGAVRYAEKLRSLVEESGGEPPEEYLKALDDAFGLADTPGREHVCLYELLRPEDIRLDVPVEGWRDAIRRAGEMLVAKKSALPGYVDNMVRVVEENGPYIVFVPGVAVAHAAVSDGARALGISLVRTEEPVVFHHPQNDPVRLVAAVSVEGGKSHMFALFNLIKLVSDGEMMELLLTAQSRVEIHGIIRYFEIKNGDGGAIGNTG